MKTVTVTKRCFASPPVLLTSITLLAALATTFRAPAQDPQRTELFFPDLPGFVTLRCDLHMHTVFSDGAVWPTVRVQEAWRDGLDAIALTDHIEYQRYKEDIPVKFGRAADVARAQAEPLGIMVIRSAEITRGEPPGHLNALFLTNVAALNQKDYRVALKNAFEQGAFVVWNHPAWKQPDHKAVWTPSRASLYEWLVARHRDCERAARYPIAHQWCLDKRLTMTAARTCMIQLTSNTAAPRRHPARDTGLREGPHAGGAPRGSHGPPDSRVQPKASHWRGRVP